MATVKTQLWPGYVSLPATGGPQFKSNIGTNFPVDVFAFDGASQEICYFPLSIINYGSGNLTLRIRWYADSGTSGDVIFGAALACITPNTDTQDVETKAFATAQTTTDTHLGTTAQRVHEITHTISNLDSIATSDFAWLKFYRDGAAAGDTINSVDVFLVGLDIEWSDT